MKDIEKLRGINTKGSSAPDGFDLLDAIADRHQNGTELSFETESLLLKFMGDKEQGGQIDKHIDAHRKTKKSSLKNFSGDKSR